MTVEVWGLCSYLIPAAALTRMERGRKRQAIVPDFRIKITEKWKKPPTK